MNQEHEPLKKRKKCISEMTTSVVLGVWSSNQLQRIKIENVDLESKVEVFKSQAFKIISNVASDIELSFGGVILENENTLCSYGVTPGVTIHILEKPKSHCPAPDKKLTESEIVNSFSSITHFNEYRSIFQRLTRKEIIDKVLQSTPGLEHDPAALALIQDPDLLMYLSHAETVAKLAKEHPVLLEAAKHILSHMHEAQTNVNLNQASTSTGYSYSLEALSDDDDMDSNSDSNITQFPITRNSSFNAITAAQLAAAIANATNTQFNANSAGMPSTPTSSNVITNEMFSSAIQQAFAVGGGNNGGFSPSTTPTRDDESLEVLTRRWEPQLQQMHEMGLVNDGVNIRALRATNGDVNAAIELVLSLSYDN